MSKQKRIRQYSPAVYDQFNFERRNSEIKDTKGKIIYSKIGIEAPKKWSDLAVRVVGSKYLYNGDDPANPVETSVKQIVHRVAADITDEGIKQRVIVPGKAQEFYNGLVSLVVSQDGSFNSPVWFNVGLNREYGVKENKPGVGSTHWAIGPNGEFTDRIDAYERPQASACFIQSIGDNMEDILLHARKEGMLFKYGSGTGTNFSTLRGINEPLSGGGIASGEISFLRIYDIIAGRIQSGGKTRRAAKMVITDADHPDVMRFIQWKVNEERKALWLSAKPEWAPKFSGDLESEAYKTVDGQNGNNSVRLTDEFMRAALNHEEWNLNFRTGHKHKDEVEIPLEKYMDDRYLSDRRFVKHLTNKRKVINAGEALEQIARAAYVTGDPGLQFDTTVNAWHTCPNSGRINASNPCSEYMFVDDSACNLASLNLMNFIEGGKLNIPKFQESIRKTITAQEILVDKASYPSEEIAKNSHRFRPLGLGYANLGAVVMSMGLAYDSEEARAFASAVTSLMTATAYETSADLAFKLGAFEGFTKNREPMLKVIKKHREAMVGIKKAKITQLEEILNVGNQTWERAETKGSTGGFRNAQVTLLAPTGTIGFMMDVDCTGVEPMIAVYSEKGLAGGGEIKREDIFPCVVSGLKTLNYNGKCLEDIMGYIQKNRKIVGAPGLKEEHYKIFATALGNENTIQVDGHLGMMAAVQPFLSGAISKTVNLPKGSTMQDIKDTYIKAWKLGLKSISLYVDGAKGVQPVNIIVTDGKRKIDWGNRDKPESRINGSFIERPGWNVDIGKTGVHFQVGEYSNRSPKESPADFFVSFGSSGSPFSGIYTSWAKEASWNRQRGEPLDEFIRHNLGATGTINGLTSHPLIRSCSSLEDFFAKLVLLEYDGDTSRCEVKPNNEQIENLRCNILGARRRLAHYESRIKFIDKIMTEGKVTEIIPLYEDEIKEGEISIGEMFCINCGSKLIPSGANCKKCPNCGDSGGCG
ncbi:MAG: vitamin B12-dependent ribonucleotide reductase [archaeon]|nr:vitamin B12-dependent ribonucleotide reductase [archaeon]